MRAWRLSACRDGSNESAVDSSQTTNRAPIFDDVDPMMSPRTELPRAKLVIVAPYGISRA